MGIGVSQNNRGEGMGLLEDFDVGESILPKNF
jgi:hypothetical protein